jgi:aryl-alcohol dehydrogenase-like predicted oxidoreductase
MHRSRSSRAEPPTVDVARLRASDSGTRRFRDRFERRFLSDFYRATTTGLTVSSLGVGTYLGDSSDAEDAAYETAIQAAVAGGINVIDTAINYRSQRSERTVGTVIQQLIAAGNTTRDELVVCTKGGYIPLDRTPPASREEYRAYVRREFIDSQILHPDEIVSGGHSLAPRFLRYCLAKSRQNLGLRTIDVYYLHNPGQQLSAVSQADFRQRLRAAFEVLEEAATRGEIGIYGIATWDSLRVSATHKEHIDLVDVVDAARSIAGDAHHCRIVQLPISIGMPEAVRGETQRLGNKAVSVVEAADALGLTVIGSASLMQGSLASGLPDAVHEIFPGLTTDAQRALAFARSLPGVTAALVGMKRVDHVEENLRGAQVTS